MKQALGPGGARAVTGEIMDWIAEFVARPHPDLGRRGAVCPYIESAMNAAMVTFSPVGVRGPSAVESLRTAVRAAMARVAPANGEGRYEAALFLPYGASDAELEQVVARVQEELRPEAIESGRMIGIFSPGNPEPGIRDPRLRPLDSPRPFLGIRTMVDTDLYFLAAPGPATEERAAAIRRWQDHFQGRTSPALEELGRQRLSELAARPGIG